MAFQLLLAILAFALAIAAGVMTRGSTPTMLICIAIACLAIIHLLAGVPLFIR